MLSTSTATPRGRGATRHHRPSGRCRAAGRLQLRNHRRRSERAGGGRGDPVAADESRWRSTYNRLAAPWVPPPARERAVILDHAGNVYRHGFPDLEHALVARRPTEAKRFCAGQTLLELRGANPSVCTGMSRVRGGAATTTGSSWPPDLSAADPTRRHECTRALARHRFIPISDRVGGQRRGAAASSCARPRLQTWLDYDRLKNERDANDAELLRAVWG